MRSKESLSATDGPPSDREVKIIKRREAWYERRLQYLLLAPAVLLLLGLTVYPMIYAITVSLSGRRGISLENFLRLAEDGFFLRSLLWTLAYTAVCLAIEFGLGLALALLLNTGVRGRSLFRSILLLPMMLPPIVVAVIWRLMFNQDFGVINGGLRQLGFDISSLTWQASPTLAMFSVIVVDVWQWTPFIFLILLAGLQAIPEDPYEAAQIDGASRWQIFRDITFPLLKPAVLIALLLRTMDLFRTFDQIYILTDGGPGFATETISLYIYKTAYRFRDFGYAIAMSFVMLAITTVASNIYIRVLRREQIAQ